MSNQDKLFEKLIAEGKYQEVLKIINKNDGSIVPMIPDEHQDDDDLKEFKELYQHDTSSCNISRVNNDFKINDSLLNLSRVADNNVDQSLLVDRESEFMNIPDRNFQLDFELGKELQVLLEKENQFYNKIINIEEVNEMQGEEIYGQMFQLEARRKIFKYKNHPLVDISKIFKSDSFKAANTLSLDIPVKREIETNMKYNSVSDFKAESFKNAIIIKELEVAKETKKEVKINKQFLSDILNKKNYSDFLSKNEVVGKIKADININSNKTTTVLIGSIRLPICAEQKYNQCDSQIAVWNKHFSNSYDNKPQGVNFHNYHNHFINLLDKKKSIQEISTEAIIKSLSGDVTNKIFDIFELEIKCENLNTIATLENFPQIKRIDLASNCFSSLDFLTPYKNVSNLIDLNICQNKLRKLDLSVFKNLTNLMFLNLEINEISKIENLQFCKKLISLNLSYNKIDKIENLENLPDLEKLLLTGNNIKTIENLSSNKKLKVLSVGKNKIKEISEIFNQIPLIEELTLFDNKIKTFTIFSLPYLKSLYLNANKLRDLNFGFCPNLEELFLQNNKLIDFTGTLADCPRLKKIDISFNNVMNFTAVLNLLKTNTQIEVVNFNNNPFHNVLSKLIPLEILLKNLFPLLKKVDYENIKNKEIKNIQKTETNFTFFNIFQQFNQIVTHLNSKFNIANFSTFELFSLVNLFNHNYYVSKICSFNTISDIRNKKITALNLFSEQFRYKKFFYYFKNKLDYIKFTLSKHISIYKAKKAKILFIQKNIRGFLIRKNMNKANKLFKFFKYFRRIKNLQSSIRNFLYRKKFKQNLLSLNTFDLEENKENFDFDFFNNENNMNIREEKFDSKAFNLDFLRESINIEQNVINEIKEAKEIINKEKLEQAEKAKSNILNISINKSISHNDEISSKNSSISQVRLLKDLKQNSNYIPYEYEIKRSRMNKHDIINIVNINGSNINLIQLPQIKTPNLHTNNKIQESTKISKQDIKLPQVPIPTTIKLNSKLPSKQINALNDSSVDVSKIHSRVSETLKSANRYTVNGRPLSSKTVERVKLLEQEEKIEIKQVKEENKYTNKELEELIIKKIRKRYKKLIQKEIMK
jgi:Leucine-rich repeat (LRR) protein